MILKAPKAVCFRSFYLYAFQAAYRGTKYKQIIKSTPQNKNEIIKEKIRKSEKMEENNTKYTCNTGCKRKHIKLI